MFCGKTHEVEVDFDAYLEWEDGKCIQDAMPNLTPTEREQLISHICPRCQDLIFGEEDEQGLTQPLFYDIIILSIRKGSKTMSPNTIDMSYAQASNLLDQLFLLALASILGYLPSEAENIPSDVLEMAQKYARNKFVELTNEWAEFTNREIRIYNQGVGCHTLSFLHGRIAKEAIRKLVNSNIAQIFTIAFVQFVYPGQIPKLSIWQHAQKCL